MTRIPALLLALLMGCDLTPNFVEASDIDDALIRNRYKTVCKGLEMKDESIRRYATTKLIEVTDPIAQECICTHIVHETKGWDKAIAEGLRNTRRDEIAGCFADLVKDPALPKRVEAIKVLRYIPAEAARAVMADIAASPGDPEVRVAALEAIGGDKTQRDILVTLLTDTSVEVRRAAAHGLTGIKDKDTKAALRTAATEDADGAVRGEALIALKKANARGIDDMLCTAMLNDESPEVRRRAITAYKGTKRDGPLACLRKKAFSKEEDGGVREQLLTVLKSSPSDKAAKILCDAIPHFMRAYVIEEIPDKIPGTDIVKAQNDRDWENSYSCVGRAYRSGGYSCFAKMYLAQWFRDLGGTSYVPNCPGYEHPSAG
jgi:hypothetical protein